MQDGIRCFEPVTAMILTYNEEANIGRMIGALSWVDEILVIDSGSTDDTLAVIARFPKARIVTRTFDTFAQQCNFGLTQVRTPWVLSLDADYEVSEALSQEICSLRPAAGVDGFRAGFTYRIFGMPLSATLYPDRVVLYRPGRARYHNEGHGHRVTVDGQVEQLRGRIYHDDRKPLERWISSQVSYAQREADYLLGTPRAALRLADRLRLMGWPMPLLIMPFTLLWKRCILDGKPGLYYALQRLFAEAAIACVIIDRRLRARSTG